MDGAFGQELLAKFPEARPDRAGLGGGAFAI